MGKKISVGLLCIVLAMSACKKEPLSDRAKVIASTNSLEGDKEEQLEKAIAHLESLTSKERQEDEGDGDEDGDDADNTVEGDLNQMTVHFENYPIVKAVQKLADFKNANIVISRSVQGAVTLSLTHVSWEQAFDALLQSQALSKITMGDVFYVASLEEISRREKQLNEIQNDAPLLVQSFQLKYAKAKEVSNLLLNKDQRILSQRGQLAVDERTNSLVIRDSEKQLFDIARFIERIDVPVKQVLIEVRIVNMDSDHESDLGIRFGLRPSPDYTSGSRSAKGSGDFNVDLPTVGAGAINGGIAVFKLSKTTLLDLELSALESEGKADIVSDPRLLTVNQQPAMIQSGEEIPYQESAGTQGTTKTSFKKAVLCLQVTPQITPDNKITLNLNLSQDKRSTYEVKGVPTIDTRQLTTQVEVENGQTIVLGGIYEQAKINGVERVPFFSEVPLIGILFKHKKQIENHRELLVFVTPKIVEQA